MAHRSLTYSTRPLSYRKVIIMYERSVPLHFGDIFLCQNVHDVDSFDWNGVLKHTMTSKPNQKTTLVMFIVIRKYVTHQYGSFFLIVSV